MKQIVIMPGGFHPFHAGHLALYQSAVKAFPGAEVYVAASNDMSERPFPFAVKEKLAKVSGVPKGRFVQVKSPFRPVEIMNQYDPDSDVLIFVRSEKDRNEQPKPGGTKKDGSLAYFQPYTGKDLKPFSQHAYMSYLPTVEFGPGITSATEIRNAWPKLNDKRKLALVMSLYPATQSNEKLGKNVVAMLDSVLGGQQGVAGGLTETRNSLFAFVKQHFPTWPDYVLKDFLYQQAKGIRDQAELDDFLKRNKQDFGNCKWTLTKLPITFDIFTPKTQRMLASREGGSSNPFQVPRDAERHALQSQMIQQKGVSAEPIIVAKLANGYDLIEGWHRTIQHLKAFPQGYTGPAWVCTGATYKSESVEQGVAEGMEHYNGIEISLEKEDDEILITAMMPGGRELGHVLFVQEGDYLMPQDLEVEERYQGQGIAATMYDYVKSKGYKIRRSGQQTDAGAGFWDKHRPEQNVWEQEIDENFADGKNPGRKGLSRRVGIPKKATLGQLEKIAQSSTGERRRMAQWQLNMRRGKKK
jgi:hypothetical protein